MRPVMMGLALIALMGVTWQFSQSLQQVYVPQKDRGAFFVGVLGPEGASFDYMERYVDEWSAVCFPASALITVLLVPTAYALIARGGGSPQDVARKLNERADRSKDAIIDPAE